jgi:predicted DNA-binding protein
MLTFIIRLPDNTTDRLKSLARSRGLSVNKLVEEMSARALAAWDTENRFRTSVSQGKVHEAMDILDRTSGQTTGI